MVIIDVCGYNKASQTIGLSFNGIQSNTMQQKNKTKKNACVISELTTVIHFV